MQPTFTHWHGRQIITRLPYVMSTEVHVHADAKGIPATAGDLMHRVDKPFDVQEIVLRLTALDAHGAVIDPQPTVLDRFVTMRLTDISKNERIANDLPFRRLPGGEVVWAPKSPLIVCRAEGFEAVFDCESFTIAGRLYSNPLTQIEAIRIRLSLEGETLILAPSMEKHPGDAPGAVT